MKSPVNEEDWTEVVERVLLAATGNLRELALLANADPESFYLGTNLDGVDVRGQDLRGMQFSNFDPARVRHDHETLFDDSHRRQQGGVLPILIASYEAIDEGAYRSLHRDNVQLFSLSDSMRFSEAATSCEVSVVLSSHYEMYSGVSNIRSLGLYANKAVLLVSSHKPADSIESVDHYGLESDVVICLTVTENIDSRKSVFERDIALAIGFIADGEYDLIRPHQGQCIFMRVLGDGAQPLLDACCQIFERAWAARIQCNELRLLSGDLRSEDAETLAIAALFDSQVSHSWIDRPLGLYAVIEVHRYIERTSKYWEEEYRSRVMAALETLRPTTSFFELFSALGSGFLEQTLLSRGRRRIPSVSWSNVTRFQLKDVKAIAIVEKCDIAWVVFQLVEHNTLCASARDVLSIPSERNLTIWAILGRQLSRFLVSEMGGGGARRRYLGMLLKEAGRRNISSDWINILDEETTSVIIESVEVGPQGTDVEFSLKYRSNHERKSARGCLKVDFDRASIEISEPPHFPLNLRDRSALLDRPLRLD